MKLCECGCGKPVTQPRKGGTAKRFATDACRARNSRERAAGPKPAPTEAGLERLEVLRRLHAKLVEDVDQFGTLIPAPGGTLRANPSATLLVRVTAELDRLEPKTEPATEGGDLISILRAG